MGKAARKARRGGMRRRRRDADACPASAQEKAQPLHEPLAPPPAPRAPPGLEESTAPGAPCTSRADAAGRVVQRVGPGGEVHEAPAKLSAEAPGGSTAAVEECVVCLDVPRSHAMVPCGHLCVCENCAEEIRGFRSPACLLCRKEAANVIRVFW